MAYFNQSLNEWIANADTMRVATKLNLPEVRDGNPEKGDFAFNSALNLPQYYDGTQWQNNDVADGAITTAKLANQAVTAAKIANATITTSQIAAATILGSNIASSTIADTNLASGVTTSGLANAIVKTDTNGDINNATKFHVVVPDNTSLQTVFLANIANASSSGSNMAIAVGGGSANQYHNLGAITNSTTANSLGYLSYNGVTYLQVAPSGAPSILTALTANGITNSGTLINNNQAQINAASGLVLQVFANQSLNSTTYTSQLKVSDTNTNIYMFSNSNNCGLANNTGTPFVKYLQAGVSAGVMYIGDGTNGVSLNRPILNLGISNTLNANQSGYTIFLGANASPYTISLPNPTAGLNYKFVTGNNMTSTIQINCPTGTLFGGVAGQTTAACQGLTNLNITATAKVGDTYYFESGTGGWTVSGTTSTANCMNFT